MKFRLPEWAIDVLIAILIVVSVGWLGAIEYDDQQIAEAHRNETLMSERRRLADERTSALVDAARAEFKRMQEDGRAEQPVHFNYPVSDVVVYRDASGGNVR